MIASSSKDGFKQWHDLTFNAGHIEREAKTFAYRPARLTVASTQQRFSLLPHTFSFSSPLMPYIRRLLRTWNKKTQVIKNTIKCTCPVNCTTLLQISRLLSSICLIWSAIEQLWMSQLNQEFYQVLFFSFLKNFFVKKKWLRFNTASFCPPVAPVLSTLRVSLPRVVLCRSKDQKRLPNGLNSLESIRQRLVWHDLLPRLQQTKGMPISCLARVCNSLLSPFRPDIGCQSTSSVTSPWRHRNVDNVIAC